MSIPSDPTTVNRIIKAMASIESVSCVIFKELEKKPDNSPDGWLHFTNPKQERECVHVFSSVDGGTVSLFLFLFKLFKKIIHSNKLTKLGFFFQLVRETRLVEKEPMKRSFLAINHPFTALVFKRYLLPFCL